MYSRDFLLLGLVEQLSPTRKKEVDNGAPKREEPNYYSPNQFFSKTPVLLKQADDGGNGQDYVQDAKYGKAPVVLVCATS